MTSTEKRMADCSSYKKAAQLNAVIEHCDDSDYLKGILSKQGTNNTEHAFNNLHCAYNHCRDSRFFKILLNHGADFTGKDNRNYTVVHEIVQQRYGEYHGLYMHIYDPIVDLILAAHVKFQNHTNPRDKYGVSHLHVACLKNNYTVVEFFLENGADIDQRVRDDSPIFAGFTPLHFAAKFSCLRTTEILLKYNPNVRLKNANGLSVLDVLLERTVNGKLWQCKEKDNDILRLLSKYDVECNKDVDDSGLSSLHVACIANDSSIVQRILEKNIDTSAVNLPLKVNSLIRPGCTPLHLAASFNVYSVKLLIDYGADIRAEDSMGITPFDICLQKHSVDFILYLVSIDKQWRDVILSDRKTKLIDMISAMRSDDEFTEFLLNFDHRSIADLTIPTDSPLWPGYTILHLTVLLSEKSMTSNYSDTYKIVECLKRGSSITKTDVDNRTPLHLAFYLQKYRSVRVLLKSVDNLQTSKNPVDNDGLSHLHIACAAGVRKAVDRLLNSHVHVLDINATINVNVKWQVLDLDGQAIYMMFAAGSTALHMNVACGNWYITRMLLHHGADVHAKDANRLTPVHRLFTSCFDHEGIDELLLNVDGLRDCRDNDAGFSHLHVAVHFNQYFAVMRLLDSDGVDIDAVVRCQQATSDNRWFKEDGRFFDPYDGSMSFLADYDGFTSLHFSIKACNELRKLALGRGADILAGSYNRSVPILDIFEHGHECDEIVLSVLIRDIPLMRRLKEQFGVTLLHIACRVNRIGLIEDSLARADDVNPRVNGDSLIWPGYTPLHLVARNVAESYDHEDNLMKGIQLLLDNGADVKLKNKTGDTPIQLLARMCSRLLTSSKCACLLLDSLKDFDVDEAHSQKMSFFHFACLTKNIEVIRRFLKNNIEVNKPVDFFADHYAGSSPLHLAAGYGSGLFDSGTQLKTVELLLEHGADVNVKDVFDNTPLHSIAASDVAHHHELFNIFLKRGVDVNAENIRGETALEVLLKSLNATWFDVEYLLKHGSRINSFNSIKQIGYITSRLSDSGDHDWESWNDEIIENLLDSDYVNQVDDEGRSILHNIVSINKVNIKDYTELIRVLVERGCDVNHRDHTGRTALHTATWFRNTRGVLGLLRNGADINVIDENGKTAFSYSFQPPRDRFFYENRINQPTVIKTFAMHVYKMKGCGLYVSEINRRLQVDALEMYDLDEEVLDRFYDDKEKSKSIELQSTPWTLYALAFEIDLDMMYSSLPFSERLEIDRFFENIGEYELHELDYLLKIKYKSAVERLRLLNWAVNPFITLLNNQLPDLSCRVILSFLASRDLKNVIALEDLF